MKSLRAALGDISLLGLAVVFGWAIWFTVREELNEKAERTVDLVVETEGGLDVVPRTRKVSVKVQGPRSAIDDFRGAPNLKLIKRLTLGELPAGTDRAPRELSRGDFELPETLATSALEIVEMDPPVVTVELFRVEVQEKTVAPPEFQGASELALRHVLQSYTNSVRVRGAKSTLSTFREIKTYVPKEQLQGFAESLRDTPKSTVRLVLEIDPSQRDLFQLVEPTELSARVELSRVAEQELVLPVQIYAATARRGAARRMQFAEINKSYFIAGDPPKVRLMVTGGPNALAALNSARVRAFVLESDLPEEQKNGDVAVHVSDLPPGLALQQEYSVYVEVGP